MIHTREIVPSEVAVLGPGPDNTDSVGAREAIECAAAAGPGLAGPSRGKIKACYTPTC